MESIALLGTSADPPTVGHQALLKGLLTLFPKVITWASNNPGKRHEIPLEKRFQLLKVLVNDIANPQLEIIHELSSPRTITTLEKAQQIWPTANLTFVIGSDLIEQVPDWVNVKSILKKTRIGIAPRDGWPINATQLNNIKILGGEIELLPLKIPSSSSSNFRKNPHKSLVPTSILPKLIQENLYGLSPNQK